MFKGSQDHPINREKGAVTGTLTRKFRELCKKHQHEGEDTDEIDNICAVAGRMMSEFYDCKRKAEQQLGIKAVDVIKPAKARGGRVEK